MSFLLKAGHLYFISYSIQRLVQVNRLLHYPGDEVEEVDTTDAEEETTEGGDSSFCVSRDGDTRRRKRNCARGNTDTSADTSADFVMEYIFWLLCCHLTI